MKTRIIPVDTIGPCDKVSPLAAKKEATFISDDECVIHKVHRDEIMRSLSSDGGLIFFELAGPREKIHFDPEKLSCGIVTCGGICPGLNDVIRSIVVELFERYGVTSVLGFRYGYEGLKKNPEFEPFVLTPESVDGIHQRGGTILSSSRGPVPVEEIVNTLVEKDIKILFTVGGDGTMRGASNISDYIKQKGLDISIIAVPKTVDNDINYLERSFGFETAVETSKVVIEVAHEEAKGAPNGVGLVKLMGRQSGFIASFATLANSNVNFCFIPECPFRLKGPDGFFDILRKRLEKKHHAVIVVAEGAGQYLMKRGSSEVETDASGNVRLKNIGRFLQDEIDKYFQEINMEANVKYINPSYILRSVPANAMDSYYCLILGQNAVHAGMTGRTNMVVGFWNQHVINVPIPMAVEKRRKVNPQGRLWKTVMESTLQPYSMFENVPEYESEV